MSGELIYFLRPVGLPGPVKIGCSVAPKFRLHAIQTWSPMILEVAAEAAGGYDLERAVHNCFADAHSHGEWFLPVPRLLRAIEAIAAGATIQEAIDLRDVRGDIRAESYRRRSEARRGQHINRAVSGTVGKRSKNKRASA